MIDDIQSNAKDFSAALARIGAMIKGDIEDIIRKAAIDLFARIALKTPVDTGRARANWNISFIDSFNVDNISWPNKSTAKSGSYQVINERAQKFTYDLDKGTKIIIYNNVVYIEFLENGTSKQRPRGMVSTSLADFANKFNEEAAKKGYII